MNEQEIASKDQETAFPEEHHVVITAGATGTASPEPNGSPTWQERPDISPSPGQPGAPPWQGYPPVAPALWSGQSGQYYPPPSYRRPARWPWIVLIFFLLFVLILVVPVVLFGGLGYVGLNNTTETRDFPVTAHPTLILSNDTGSIHVRATSADNVIAIRATKHSSPWANADDLRVSYAHDQRANSVTVTVDRLNTMTFFSSASVDFDVTLPASADLQLKTNTGSIDVTGVSGQIALTSNTGSLDVTNGALNGTSSLITNTGSVTFDGAIDRGGAYHFATNTGSVTVTLPAGSVFHVEASTDTGSINTTFAGILVRQNQGVGASASGDVGSLPRATMSLRTNTGSINLYQR